MTIISTTYVYVAAAIRCATIYKLVCCGIFSFKILARVLRADNLHVNGVALSHLEGDVGVAHLNVNLLAINLILSLIVFQYSKGQVLHKEILLVGADGTTFNLVNRTSSRCSCSFLVNNCCTSSNDDSLFLLDRIKHVNIRRGALGGELSIVTVDNLRVGGYCSRLLQSDRICLFLIVTIHQNIVFSTFIGRSDCNLCTISLDGRSVKQEVYICFVVCICADKAFISTCTPILISLELHRHVLVALDWLLVNGTCCGRCRAVCGVCYDSGDTYFCTFHRVVISFTGYLTEPETAFEFLLTNLYGRRTRSLVGLDDDETNEHITII